MTPEEEAEYWRAKYSNRNDWLVLSMSLNFFLFCALFCICSWIVIILWV